MQNSKELESIEIEISNNKKTRKSFSKLEKIQILDELNNSNTTLREFARKHSTAPTTIYGWKENEEKIRGAKVRDTCRRIGAGRKRSKNEMETNLSKEQCIQIKNELKQSIDTILQKYKISYDLALSLLMNKTIVDGILHTKSTNDCTNVSLGLSSSTTVTENLSTLPTIPSSSLLNSTNESNGMNVHLQKKGRNSFTKEQKLYILDEISNTSKSVRSIGKKYNIGHSVIQGWISNEEKLRCQNVKSSCKRIGAGRRPFSQEYEEDIKQWIYKQQNEHIHISRKDILIYCQQNHPNMFGKRSINAQKHWLSRFICRHNIEGISDGRCRTTNI